MKFKKGDLVMCVDAKNEPYIKEGIVYEVRSCKKTCFGQDVFLISLKKYKLYTEHGITCFDMGFILAPPAMKILHGIE